MKDEIATGNLIKEATFPQCFKLSEKALKLVIKFGGYTPEEKGEAQRKLLYKLD